MKTRISADAVIVSAGKGRRFGKNNKKQFLSLAGKPILAHTLTAFESCPLIRSIVLVVGQEDMERCLSEIVERYRYQKIGRIIPGGRQRQESSKRGIDALPPGAEIVVIHDGVRPFVSQEMIEKSIRSMIRYQAVVYAVPVKETIKAVGPDGTVLKTLDRKRLWHIQTPQTFRIPSLKEAFRRACEDDFVGTDDASLVERVGGKVHVLPGSYANIKITTPEDLIFAEFISQNRGLLEHSLSTEKPDSRRKKER